MFLVTAEHKLKSHISISVTAGTNVRSYLEEQAEGALKRLYHLQTRKKQGIYVY